VDQWTCLRCGTNNGETIAACTACGQSRGDTGIVGSPAEPVSEQAPSAPAQAALGEQSAPSVQPAPGEQPGLGGQAALGQQPAPGAPTDWPAIEMAPPPAKPIWQRIPWGAAILVVVIGGGAIAGLIFNAARSDSGEISKSGDLTAAELRVGDCYDLKDPTAEELEQVTARPCAEEHEYEMIFAGDVPEGPYPNEDAFVAYVGDQCIPAFNAFVGTDYETSSLDIAWLEPTSASWMAGDRSVQCAVYDPQQPRVVGSLKGANR
jgi:hypothetical protein